MKNPIENDEKFERVTIRQYFADHFDKGEENFLLARTKALCSWYENTRFCPKCGKYLAPAEKLNALECQNKACKKIIFPRIEPCVIVVVKKGEKILLVRHVQRNQDIFACVAGFVEAGESAEHAVEREVFEETGLKIKNIKFEFSQSWPFDNQLMLGYTAEWESGDFVLQKEEICEAGWFDTDNLPPCPKPGSIAYRLIQLFSKK